MIGYKTGFGALLLATLVSMFLSPISAAQPEGQQDSFALLDVRGPNFHQTKICANYQQFFLKTLPRSVDDAPAYNFAWWNNQPNLIDVCKENTAKFNGKITASIYARDEKPPTVEACQRKSNETAFIQAQMDRLDEYGASAALFLLERGKPSVYHELNYLFSRFYNPKVTNKTSTFYLYLDQFNDIISKAGLNSDQVFFRFYRPADSFLDAGVFVLLALSTGCILAGCLWYAASLRRKIALGDLKVDSSGNLVDSSEHGHLPVRQENSSSGTETPDVERPDVPERVCCCKVTSTCLHIFYSAQALTIVVVVLLLSFFYRQVAVEVFNVIVVIGGTLSMQACVIALIRLGIRDPKLRSLSSLFRINEEKRADRCWVPAFVYKPIRPISCFIFILSFAFALTWRLNVNGEYAYLMLDLMNVAICVYGIKASELRSLRLITFFLIAMFIYDIVMVFGTRLVTENGCSVMVQVVTGMDCTKQRATDYSSDWPIPPVSRGFYNRPPKIPLLFYVPMLSNPVGHCFDTKIEGEYLHMMLGLGDVIAPGYAIAYAFYLDVRKMNRFHLYGFTALSGYAFGMVSTFVSLKLMATAQPALIYLVPFTLIPLILLCLYKGTLREVWTGNLTPN